MGRAVEDDAALIAYEVREARRLTPQRRPGRRLFNGLGSVAERAVAVGPDPRRPCVGVEYPRPYLERRTMADVLAMPTRKLGDPVSSHILLEPDDHLPH
jgi:hypothetical protein